MATNFPTSLDTLTNPSAGDPTTNPSHAAQHANANDAIEALEAKVGVNGSAVTTSLDYRLGLNFISKTEFVTSTAVNIDNCFSATYQIYRLQWFINGSTAAAYIYGRLRSGGVAATSNYTSIGWLMGVTGGTGTAGNIGTGNQGVGQAILGYWGTANAGGGGFIDIARPFIADYTSFTFSGGGNNNNSALSNAMGQAIHYTGSSYDGIQLFPSSGSMTGTVYIYGYKVG